MSVFNGMNIYGQLLNAQLQNSTTDLNNATGMIYFNTSTGFPKWYSGGSGWKTGVDADSTQTLANKTFQTVLTVAKQADTTIKMFLVPEGTTGTTTTLTANQTATRSILLPDASTTLVGTDNTQSLTNKALATCTFVSNTCAFVNQTDTTKQAYIFANGAAGTYTAIVAAQTSSRIINLPDASDTLVGRATSDTLTNKKLDDTTTYIVNTADATKRILFDVSNVATTGTTLTLITFHTADRTIAFPNASTTLVGRDTSDTLTNKLITAPVIVSAAEPSSPADAGNIALFNVGDELKTKTSAGAVATVCTTGVTAYTDIAATVLGLKSYSHGTAYNGGGSPTITLSAGGGTLTTVNQSSFIPYKMEDGSWRMKFNFYVTLSSTARTGVIMDIDGISVGGFEKQAVSVHEVASNTPATASTQATGATGPAAYHASASTTTYSFSGDIQLASAPTWAYT